MSFLGLWNCLATAVVGWCIFKIYDSFMASFVDTHTVPGQNSNTERQLASTGRRNNRLLHVPGTPGSPNDGDRNTTAKPASAVPVSVTPSPSYNTNPPAEADPPAGADVEASTPWPSAPRGSGRRRKSTPSQRSRSDSTATPSSATRGRGLASLSAPDFSNENAGMDPPWPSRGTKKIYNYRHAMFAHRLKHNNVFQEEEKSRESLARSWDLLEAQPDHIDGPLSFEDFDQKRRDCKIEPELQSLIHSVVEKRGVHVEREVRFTISDFASMDAKEDRITRGQPDFMHAENYDEVKTPLGLADNSHLWQFLRPSVNGPLCLPNFFIEVKGPTGTSRDLYHQALYNGGVGARAMHKVRRHQGREPLFDDVPRTVSITIDHSGRVVFYLSRAMELKNPNPDSNTDPDDPDSNTAYTLIRVGCLDMCEKADHWKWQLAIARAHEWAQKMRESVLSAEDEFKAVPFIPEVKSEDQSPTSSANAVQSAEADCEDVVMTDNDPEPASTEVGEVQAGNDWQDGADGHETCSSSSTGGESEEESEEDNEYDTPNTTLDTSTLEVEAILRELKLEDCAALDTGIAKPAEPMGVTAGLGAGLDAEATTVAPLAA